MRHEILFIEVSSANALWIQEHNTLHSMKMKRHHTSLNDHFDGESSLKRRCLTLRLLMSYIYMELLVKPEILTSYIYGPTFGNAET